MPRKPENLVGQRFGRLVVLEDTKIMVPNRTQTYQKCLCDCGNIVIVPKSYLKSEHTRSCGCWVKEMHTTHGLSQSRIYKVYSGMKKRCYDKNHKIYNRYGGRGITICDEWLNDFMAFYNWSMANGYQDNLTIDRIDNNKGYSPDNCRWVTMLEQAQNTSKNVNITYKGKTQTISAWSRETGIPQNTISRRFRVFNNLDIVFYKGDLKKCKKMLHNQQ